MNNPGYRVEHRCGRGECTCGAIFDGSLMADRAPCDGSSMRVPLFLSDAAPGAFTFNDGGHSAMTQDREREIAEARRQAAYDHMTDQMSNEWRGGASDNPGTSGEAYKAMCDHLDSAWKAAR